ncbi:MAG: hypothetical protein IKJ14_00585 [Clostridia bacterium]|nr:hypothetical protein [Clostridia bacterium]
MKAPTFHKEENNIDINTTKKTLIDRVEYEVIGNTVYTIRATQAENATKTALDVMREIINRETDNLIRKERTCYLQTNGGKSKC